MIDVDTDTGSPSADDHERLRRAQRLRFELVGRLAGPVTHDINNRLGVIMTYVDLLGDAFAPGSQEAEDLREIGVAARSIAELSRWLNGFAIDPAEDEGEGATTAEVVASVTKIGSRLLARSGLEAEFRATPSHPPIAVNAPVAQDLVFGLLASVEAEFAAGTVHLDTDDDPERRRGRIVIEAQGERRASIAAASLPFSLLDLPGQARSSGGFVVRTVVDDRTVRFTLELPGRQREASPEAD